MPPIHHLALVQLKADVDAATSAALFEPIAALGLSIPDLLYFRLHTVLPTERIPAGHMVNTLGITHVVQVLLPSAEALQSYEQHPAHVAALTPAMPRVQQVIAVDVEMPGLDVDAFLRLQHALHVHHLTLIRPNAGVNRAQLSTTMQQWGALPIVVPQLVWASVGFAADKPLYDGWRDMTQGYSVVSDMMGRDLQSMAGYTQSEPHMQLAPAVVGVTNIQEGGLIAVDWQL